MAAAPRCAWTADAVNRSGRAACRHGSGPVPRRPLAAQWPPAACTLKFQVGGLDILYTIRDATDDALFARIRRILPRIQEKVNTPPENGTALQQGTHWCPIHKVSLKRFTKGDQIWYSHKLADGSWCKRRDAMTPSIAYQVITDRILALLEHGVIPWQQPWTGGWPRNLVSGRPYRGINVLLLSSQPYTSSYWLSFPKQVNDLGGRLRKGEHVTYVVLWKPWELSRQDENTPRCAAQWKAADITPALLQSRQCRAMYWY
jgi:N-terminal domain of anti-restriction factor ArdC